MIEICTHHDIYLLDEYDSSGYPADMARAHESRSMQVEMTLNTWGGKRRGAGRPPKGRKSSEPHKTRERFSKPTPLHVTLRVVDEVGRLRRQDAYDAICVAMRAVLGRS